MKRTPPNLCRRLLLWLLAGCAIAGCASQSEWVTVRSTPDHFFAGSRHVLPQEGGSKPSERTLQLLRRYNLEDRYRDEVDAVAAELNGNATDATRHEHEYAAAELEYLAAKRVESSEPDRAIGHYGTALLHTYRYLFDDASGVGCNPYDPQFRGACDLYNRSLEGMLRLVRRAGELRPGELRTVQTATHLCSLKIELHSRGWHAENVDSFEFVSDYQVGGLRNHYRSYGLGVPLIAVRRSGHVADPTEAFYPPGLCFPLTAFLRINDAQPTKTDPPNTAPTPDAPRFVLELRDPIDGQTFDVAGRTAPLESDLSTPLAYYLNRPELSSQDIPFAGLLRPDSVRDLQGLYMLEPFDPAKMPVVMVHGLFSSPVTWMEMFNDLRSDRLICDRYQFWFYLYPTGQPFWMSGAQMRRDLAALRQAVDPKTQHAALDQMVLVGHSMGGLVSKLQSVESGQEFWRINSDREFTELNAEPELRKDLAGSYFFRPNPSVRRVVTIGTPHRGSEFANDFTRWLGRKLIAAPMRVVQGRQSLLSENPDYFRRPSAFDIRTSIDSLAPNSPLLPVLLTARPGPWVEYHNIVGRLPDEGWHKYLGESGDGVVTLASARLDEAPQLASQAFVPADHVSVHRHPQSIYEVRRILLEQLAELEALPYGPGGPVRLVERPPATPPGATTVR